MPKNQIPSKQDAIASGYAIVEASGQQFWLQANRYYDFDHISAEIDQTITIDKVLLFHDGKQASLGKPYVKDATVKLKVIEHRRGPKIIIYKMRPKKKTRRKNGHRQELTRVMVESISIGGKPTKAVQSEKAPKSEKSSTSATKASKITGVSDTPKIEKASKTAKPKAVKAPIAESK